jgi:hypothetical protein
MVSVRWLPPASRKLTSTRSGASRPPAVRRAKSRSVGRSRPTHTCGLVALAPAGSAAAREPSPATAKDSLPATAAAPPERAQPCPPASKPPSPTGMYQARSSQGRNGCDTDGVGQSAAEETRTPAWAADAVDASAPSAAASAARMRMRCGTSWVMVWAPSVALEIERPSHRPPPGGD